MPKIYTNKSALRFWENNLQSNARSLAATRYVYLAESDKDSEWRKKTVAAIKNGTALTTFAEHNARFSSQLESQGSQVIYAKLEARLILNAATGVVENGGVSLDRNSGLPLIPGSAIKAAARRYAIQELSEEDNLEKKAKLLAQLAITYGYGDQEWLPERKTDVKHPHSGPSRSDFWLAMTPLSEPGSAHDDARNTNWKEVAELAKKIIYEKLNLTKVPKQLAGCIAFLPALPTRDPGIEADIITNHHPAYYDGKQKIALDNENPNPIVFPAVLKGASFRFTVTPLGSALATELLPIAAQHLSEALQIMGLGAKTNAGYGWFSIDHAAQTRAEKELQDRLEKKAREAHRSTLSEEELIAEDLSELPHEEFATIVANLEQEDPEKQKIVCQMLLRSQKEQWKTWCKKKKGRWTKRVPKIREIAKHHHIELP